MSLWFAPCGGFRFKGATCSPSRLLQTNDLLLAGESMFGHGDYTLKYWNLDYCQCVQSLEGHKGIVNAVAILPGGHRAVSGSWDHTLKLWDLDTGKCLRTFEGHTRDVNALAIVPDGNLALSGGSDDTIRMWDLDTGKCLRTFEGHTEPVHAVCDLARRPSRRIGELGPYPQALGSRHGPLHTHVRGTHRMGEYCRALARGLSRRFRKLGPYYQALGRPHRQVPADSPGTHWRCDCPRDLADGNRALSGSTDNTIKLWDLDTEQAPRTREGHTTWVRGVALHPDGQRALSVSWDGTLKLWSLHSGQCLQTLRGQVAEVSGIAVFPDAHRALFGDSDHAPKLWDIDSCRCLQTLSEHANSLLAVGISSDGRYALAADGYNSPERALKLWDIETGRCLQTIQGYTEAAGAGEVALLPDGRHALSGSDCDSLRFWDLVTGQCLRTYDGCYSPFALSSDGSLALTTTTQRKTLNLLDLESGRCVQTLQCHTQPSIRAIALSSDNRRVLSAGFDKFLKLWDFDSGLCLATWPAGTEIQSCAIAADILSLGTGNGSVLFLKLMPPGRIVHKGNKKCVVSECRVQTIRA